MFFGTPFNLHQPGDHAGRKNFGTYYCLLPIVRPGIHTGVNRTLSLHSYCTNLLHESGLRPSRCIPTAQSWGFEDGRLSIESGLSYIEVV